MRPATFLSDVARFWARIDRSGRRQTCLSCKKGQAA
jgi:hypothetical protein